MLGLCKENGKEKGNYLRRTRPYKLYAAKWDDGSMIVSSWATWSADSRRSTFTSKPTRRASCCIASSLS